MENVRIYEMPRCKMVASQCGMFGDGKLERFDEWFSSLPKSMFPRDFLSYDQEQECFIWYYMFDEGMEVPDEFCIIDFSGGLYAVTTGVDGEDNSEEMEEINTFIKEKGCFEKDPSRVELGNIPNPQSAGEVMGYNQMNYYVPIKIKK